MARAIWKGSISFGLVNIPVGLYTAEQRDDISMHLLDRRNMSRVRYKRVNEETGREVPWDEIVHGYEYGDGQYVVLSDEDLKRANPEATQTIDIVGFVDEDEISPLYFDKPYYLGAQKKGEKSYALLREALKRTGKVGIALVVIRTRQYLAAVIPQGDLLVLELLRFGHELRQAEDLDLPGGGEVSARELEMAERLVEGMVTEWDPSQYRDEYRDDLKALIRERVAAGQTEGVDEPAPEPKRPEGGKVVDLMALLKRSLDEREAGGGAAKKAARKKSAAKPAKKAEKRPKKAAKKPARKTAARKTA